MVRGTALAGLVVAGVVTGLAASALATEMASASYRILGANLNAGGHPALLSGAPAPAIGSAGTSIGQSEALGFSGSAATLRTVAPGFWPIVGGGLPSLDMDGDVIQSFRDNCPWAFNPAQSDSGGIDDLAADGIGDACQCGDVDDDGIVDALDVLAYRDFLAAPALAPLPAAGLSKCSVIDSAGPCQILDVTVTQRVLVPLLPDVEQVCAAARP